MSTVTSADSESSPRPDKRPASPAQSLQPSVLAPPNFRWIILPGKAKVFSQTSSVVSGSLRIQLPLSHQFSFYSLGDDYHGRFRRFQLDMLGPKIEVQKEVEVALCNWRRRSFHMDHMTPARFIIFRRATVIGNGQRP
jgi:hypothetical protein